MRQNFYCDCFSTADFYELSEKKPSPFLGVFKAERLVAVKQQWKVTLGFFQVVRVLELMDWISFIAMDSEIAITYN